MQPSPPRPLRGVLFDLDGVLVDSVRAWHRTIDAGAQRRGFPGVSWERFSGTFGQGVEADEKSFFPGLGAEGVSRLYEEEFPRHLEAVELMPGAREVLASLTERGLARAVVTNTPHALAEQVLTHKGLRRYVQLIAGGGDAPEKPRPELVELALAGLDLTSSDVLYVGDSASDEGATRSAGVRFVGLRYAPSFIRIERLEELLTLL